MMIKALTMAILSLLAILSTSCLAIQPSKPIIQDRTVTCTAPTTREDDQPLDITEIDYFKITFGLISDTGTGTELRTESNDCRLVLPPLLPGEYHAFAITRTTDGMESQPIESDPFTVNAGPQSAGNLEIN